jgi:4-hydroxy-tetrahydrodipicolinate reductase
MRALSVGYGRMGKLVESLCPEYGMEVAGTVDVAEAAAPESWPSADVAIDFSIAEAVPANVRRLAERGVNVVIGTTGWAAHEADVRRVAGVTGIGVVAAPNFALGVNQFSALAVRAAELFESQAAFGAWIHEAHHAAKRDAPSGTALLLEAALRAGGYNRAIDVSSTRAGSIPGVVFAAKIKTGDQE